VKEPIDARDSLDQASFVKAIVRK